ncbi:hypothetical protein [Dictyobacter formicarum]|uniref:DUF2690 domain-containing protein n=1 Tax=Dictyobacter formicarum TaxID=2778368 RepID=A0ABQ3V982_9CHLR|nr:hypothetical protein [Dictyobacter formicarum]GHO82344.1 hypothetical protein KSZ_03500 [Dictyobacter formicarum]
MIITPRRKHTQPVRIIILAAITCLTTLLVFFGSQLLHVSDFSFFSRAHAAITCASTHGTQQAVCEQQNPIVQGCTQDSHMIELQSVFTAQNELIGVVNLLHSAICKTYWINTLAYANAQQRVAAIDAVISFHNGRVEDVKHMVLPDGRQTIALTDMVFALPNIRPTNWAGTFFLKGQTQPITIPV